MTRLIVSSALLCLLLAEARGARAAPARDDVVYMWSCDASCLLKQEEGSDAQCPTGVTASGRYTNRTKACNQAKAAAREGVPAGCRVTNCTCQCSKGGLVHPPAAGKDKGKGASCADRRRACEQQCSSPAKKPRAAALCKATCKQQFTSCSAR